MQEPAIAGHPGSVERIRCYRQRYDYAERTGRQIEIATNEQATDTIPLLPSINRAKPEGQRHGERNPMDITIEEAIERLTAGDASAEVQERIDFHKGEIAKLNSILKTMGGKKKQQAARKPAKLGEAHRELERRIIEALGDDEFAPAVIADQLGVHPIQVGKVVSASERLEKRGLHVRVV